MDKEEKYIGYLKYTGSSVEKGFLDARKASSVLLGLDDAMRFYIEKNIPIGLDIEFEIPIKIQKGSWIAFIPYDIYEWIKISIGVGFTAYTGAALAKIAQNDFDDVKSSDLFKKALESIQWTIKIASHLGHFIKKDLNEIRWRNDNKEIGLLGKKGDYMYVPKEYFELYINTPENILSKMVSIVDEKRDMHVGVFDEGGIVNEVGITKNEKQIFFTEDSNEEVIFPELEHGQLVELVGKLTRGNERTNSVGFEYSGHVLACIPESGSIVRFKQSLFENCKITGIIDRADKFGKIIEKKPKIIFKIIVSLQSNKKPSLFN